LAAILAFLLALTLMRVPYYGHQMVLEFGLGIGVAVAYQCGLRLPSVLGPLLIAIGLGAIVATGTSGDHTLLQWGIPAAFIVAGAVLGPDAPANRLGAPSHSSETLLTRST
jgi:hypothetical protein